MTSIIELVGWFFLLSSGIGLLWWIGYKWHTYSVSNFYKHIVMNMDKLSKNEKLNDVSKIDRMLKVFFYRQTTYEFSAYALLVLCIVFLLGCIYLFMQAGTLAVVTERPNSANPNEYIISVISIRLGISLVIFFICQVLLKLYRYCLHFTAFYTGLFDALFLYKEIDRSIEDSIQLFSLKEGLEKAPESPTDKIIEILKNLKMNG